MDTMDKSLEWTMERWVPPEDDGDAIAERIKEGTMEVVSDGGLKDFIGTSAGLSKGLKAEESYMFQNCVPGDDAEQTSYCSELCGILGNVIILTRLAAYHKVESGEVTVGCNNKAALWKAFGCNTAKTGEPSFDIL